MRHLLNVIILLCTLMSCQPSVETTQPEQRAITESVYATGIVKARNQYQAYASVSGLLESILVREGDTVKSGTPLMTVRNTTASLVRENAELAARLADVRSNEARLEDLRLQLQLLQTKLINDSLLYIRQKQLWNQAIGSKVELERMELAYTQSRTNLESARIRYDEEKRRLRILTEQARNQTAISRTQENDFIVTSFVNGRVYSILREPGEIITPQMPLAVIGETSSFFLELNVDEYDITRIKPGMEVKIILDSYKNQVFDGTITQVNPILDPRTKTAVVEVEFSKPPPTLFPNLTAEANIILQVKSDALIIPRAFLVQDSIVLLANGDSVTVETGIRDYQYVEILRGLEATQKIRKPE